VILVVDDEPFVLNSVAAVLEYAGYFVLRASSGREALRLAAGHCAPIHLLVTDVRMPVTNGPRLATQFAALHPEARCLFMAGLPDHPDLPESARREKKALLAKPFTAKVLLEAVRQALAPAARTA
jgi:DNA-binding NtrC family response regulator